MHRLSSTRPPRHSRSYRSLVAARIVPLDLRVKLPRHGDDTDGTSPGLAVENTRRSNGEDASADRQDMPARLIGVLDERLDALGGAVVKRRARDDENVELGSVLDRVLFIRSDLNGVSQVMRRAYSNDDLRTARNGQRT